MPFYGIAFLIALLASFAPARAATSVPFAHRGGLIWVTVQLEGFGPANFLLDSGAGATLLDQRLARKIGLREGKQQWVRGAQGLTPAYSVEGVAGSLGGCAIPTSALAVDLNGLLGQGRQIDGLLGVDFFEDRIVEIDYSAQRLRLLNRGELLPSAGHALPIARRKDAVCIQVGMAGEKPCWMRLDTGCNSAVEWVAPAQARQGGNAASFDVQLGSIRVTSVKTGLHAQALFPGERGLVGNGLLSKWRVTVDLAENRVFLASAR